MPAADQAAAPGLGASIEGIWRELRALLGALADLVAIEGRLAAASASLILALAVVAGVLIVSAWLFLVSAGVTLAVGVAGAWPLALAGAAACNGAAAAVTWLVIRRLTRNLTFPELRARLAAADTAAGGSDTPPGD